MIVISLVICDLTTNTNNNEYTLDSSKLNSIIFISIWIHLNSNLKTIITMWPEGIKYI
jgi:hypothetical protein